MVCTQKEIGNGIHFFLNKHHPFQNRSSIEAYIFPIWASTDAYLMLIFFNSILAMLSSCLFFLKFFLTHAYNTKRKNLGKYRSAGYIVKKTCKHSQADPISQLRKSVRLQKSFSKEVTSTKHICIILPLTWFFSRNLS